MISPRAILRGSLEYVLHRFGNQTSLTAAAVTISRQIAERLGTCREGRPLKIFAPAPAPSPCSSLESPVRWQTVVAICLRAVSCPGFLCPRLVKNSLLLAVIISCLPWVRSEPCGCSRCQPAGIQQVNVFIVGRCECG